VLAVNPVKLLMKLPVPLPSFVCEPAIVGLGEVLQQTPLSVIVPPPSEIILPPDVTVF